MARTETLFPQAYDGTLGSVAQDREEPTPTKPAGDGRGGEGAEALLRGGTPGIDRDDENVLSSTAIQQLCGSSQRLGEGQGAAGSGAAVGREEGVESITTLHRLSGRRGAGEPFGWARSGENEGVDVYGIDPLLQRSARGLEVGWERREVRALEGSGADGVGYSGARFAVGPASPGRGAFLGEDEQEEVPRSRVDSYSFSTPILYRILEEHGEGGEDGEDGADGPGGTQPGPGQQSRLADEM